LITKLWLLLNIIKNKYSKNLFTIIYTCITYFFIFFSLVKYCKILINRISYISTYNIDYVRYYWKILFIFLLLAIQIISIMRFMQLVYLFHRIYFAKLFKRESIALSCCSSLQSCEWSRARAFTYKSADCCGKM